MDDDELYREMNEEDDFYMGDQDEGDENDDPDDYESGAEYVYCNTSSTNNAGCVLLPLIIVLMTLAVILVM